MESGVIVQQANDDTAIETAGIVETALFEEQLATPSGTIEDDPLNSCRGLT